MSIYRYGDWGDCSEQWSDFWWCMKNRNNSDKREKIREHFMQKDEKYKTGPSSEDIWEARTEKVKRAFDRDPDKVTMKDEMID